jgi:hypothetical protein
MFRRLIGRFGANWFAANDLLPMNMGERVVTLGEARVLRHSCAFASAGRALEGIARLLDNLTATPAIPTAA